MNLTPAHKSMLDSYLRNLLAQVIGAIAIVGNGMNPIEFTASQWAQVSNVLWASLIPVVLRYVNKKDPAFGRIAEPILIEAKKKTAKAIVKKAAKKVPVKKSAK